MCIDLHVVTHFFKARSELRNKLQLYTSPRLNNTSKQVQLLHVFTHSSVFCQLSVGGWTQAAVPNPPWCSSCMQATKKALHSSCVHQSMDKFRQRTYHQPAAEDPHGTCLQGETLTENPHLRLHLHPSYRSICSAWTDSVRDIHLRRRGNLRP